MKKLSKKQLKEIAIRHCAGVLLATEAVIAFDGTGITNEEAKYIDSQIENLALRLLNGKKAVFTSGEIVKEVRGDF